MMVFPDGSTTTVAVVRQDPPYVLEIVYFGTPTRLVVQASGEHATELRVTASSIPPGDLVEIAAGWVSVLLNLKVAINFGKDLRNHDPTRTWVDGFIDN